MPTNEAIRTSLLDIYSGTPWYGQNIRKSLATIPAADWHRPVGHQNVARIVAHMLAWRDYLVEKLRGNESVRLVYQSPEEWPDASGSSKEELLERMDASTGNLAQLLAADADLGRELTDKPYTLAHLAEGIVQHDLYHLGQINLMAVLLKNAEV